MWPNPWGSQLKGGAQRWSPSPGGTLVCWLILEIIKDWLIFPQASCKALNHGFFGDQCTLPNLGAGG